MSATEKVPANTLYLAKCLEEEESSLHKDFKGIERRVKESGCPVDVREPDSKGRSALMIACRIGLEGLVEYLLDRGVDVDEEYLDEGGCTDDSDFDPDNGEDVCMTPLMIACKYGYPGIVDRLIASGADVNKKCNWEFNTPLHFAVASQHGGRWSIITDETNDHWKKPMSQKLEVVKSLLQHGASVEKVNSGDVNPIQYAALNSGIDIVQYFFSGEQKKRRIKNSDKVHILEQLAFSLTTQDHFMYKYDDCRAVGRPSIGSSNYNYRFIVAAKVLEEAIKLRRPKTSRVELEEVLQLESAFGRSECKTVDDLAKIKNDEIEMRKEGFLIGARIIPDELMEEMFYGGLLSFSFPLLKRDLDEGFRVLTFCIKQEMEGEILPLGTTYASIAPTNCPGMNSVYGQKKYCKLIEYFCEALSQADPVHMEWSIGAIFEYSADFTFTIATEFDGAVIDEALRVMEKMVETIHQRLASRSRERDVCFAQDILDTASSIMKDDCSCSEFHSRRFYGRIHQFVSRFLFHEDSSYKGKGGCTMLHTLMKMVNKGHPSHFNFILPMASTLVHHGCPVDAKTSKGKTAAMIAVAASHKQQCCWRSHRQCPEYDQLIQLLTVRPLASLEELAAGVIVRHRIPYRKELPRPLWTCIEKGTYSIKLSEIEAEECKGSLESEDSFSDMDDEDYYLAESTSEWITSNSDTDS